MPTPPTTWASLKRTLGVAVEAVPGTAVAPTSHMPFITFNWNDKPTWLEDKAKRGVMSDDAFAVIQGVQVCEFDFEAPGYADTVGFLLGNLFGDVVGSGTTTAPTGTLAALSIIGATSVSSSVSIPNSTLIQIDTGVLAEVVTTTGVPTGAGPFTIPVPALTKPHANTVPITAITTPYSHAFSLLNSGQGKGMPTGNAQPSTHTWTQYYGPASGGGTRQFTNVVISEVTFKWNAESEFLMVSAKGMAYVSNTTTQPTPTYSAALPIPSWRGQLGLAGPASGGTLVLSCESGEYTVKRTIQPLFTAQASQNPYFFQRGGLSADFKNTFVAADESVLLYMRNNTQPIYQWVLSNGQAGALALGFQLDMQQAAFTEAKPGFGKEAIEFDAAGKGVLNTTNAGYSGGYSPAKVTLTNAVAPGTYV